MYEPTDNDYNLLKQHIKNPYIRLSICDQNDIYNVIDIIDSVVISDNFNIDVTSDVRRTCNLTLSVDKSYDILDIEKKIWINKIIFIEYGIADIVNNTIQWYSFGYFTFTDFIYNVTQTSYTLQINCIDLVGLYNGTVGGYLSGQSIYIPAYENLWERFQEYNDTTEPDIDLPTEDQNGWYNVSAWISWLNEYYDESSQWYKEYLTFKIKAQNNNNCVQSEDFVWRNTITKVLTELWEENNIPSERLNIIIDNKSNELPYDLTFNTNTTIWDIVTSLKDLAECYQAYFDINGFFVFELTPEGSSDEQDEPQPNIDMNDLQDLIITESLQQHTTNIFNVIQIFGLTSESDVTLDLDNSSVWTPDPYNFTFYNLTNLSSDTPIGTCFIINTENLESLYNNTKCLSLDGSHNNLKNLVLYDYDGKQIDTTVNLPKNTKYFCSLSASQINFYKSNFFNITSVANYPVGTTNMLHLKKSSGSITNNHNFCFTLPDNHQYDSYYANLYPFVRIGSSNCYDYYHDKGGTDTWYGFKLIDVSELEAGYSYMLLLWSNTKYSPGQFRGINDRKLRKKTNITTNLTLVDSSTSNFQQYINDDLTITVDSTCRIIIPENNFDGIFIKIKNGIFPLYKDNQYFTNAGDYIFNFDNNQFNYVGDAQVFSTVILTSNANRDIEQDIKDEGDFNIKYLLLPDNLYTVEQIGKKRQIYNDSFYAKIDSIEKASERCLYELWHNNNITNQLTLSIVMIPWLQGNEIIQYFYQKINDGKQHFYVIKQIQGSVSSWTQNITLQEFKSFHPPINWSLEE